MSLIAQPINCTLKSDPKVKSSTDAMITLLAGELGKAQTEVAPTIRIAAHSILPGVTSDEGRGDEWPAWSSEMKTGRTMSAPGLSSAQRCGLDHPRGGRVLLGWRGHIGDTDFQDRKALPRGVAKTTRMVAANAAHLAALLKDRPFPAG